jgi:hypothetical protein
MDIKELKEKVTRFRHERVWAQYHNPKDAFSDIHDSPRHILTLKHRVCDSFSVDAHGYFMISFAPIKRVRIIGSSGNRVRKGDTSGTITIIAGGTNAPERPGLLTRRTGEPGRGRALPEVSE